MKTIKDALKEANKYEDVRKELAAIADTKSPSIPVDTYIRDGEVHDYVLTRIVKEESIKLTEDINSGKFIRDLNENDYNNLLKVIQHYRDQLTNNYVVSLAHRQEPTISLDTIRTYLILWNLLACIGIDSDSGWTIPDGWKKD